MKGTIREWLGDAIGAICLCVLLYGALWLPYILAPCNPATEQCETGEKP